MKKLVFSGNGRRSESLEVNDNQVEKMVELARLMEEIFCQKIEVEIHD